MSREIKFRQCSHLDKMCYEPMTLVEAMELDDEEVPEDNEQCLYTNLKDENGKEIYEGDIVNCRGSHSTNNLVVEKDDNKNGCGGYKPFVDSWGSGGQTVPFYQVRNCEIIGNIYENPELIEVS